MRKCVALILSLVILLGVCPAGALTDEKVYSIEAAEEYRDAWNAYFSEKGMDLEIGYFLTDDQTQIDSFDVLYYGPFSESDSLLEAIPATASLFFIYDVRERTFGFCVIDNNLKSDLEKIVLGRLLSRRRTQRRKEDAPPVMPLSVPDHDAKRRILSRREREVLIVSHGIALRVEEYLDAVA